jgi:hypothetical protein
VCLWPALNSLVVWKPREADSGSVGARLAGGAHLAKLWLDQGRLAACQIVARAGRHMTFRSGWSPAACLEF